jgi:hypothetical protein
MAYGQVRQRVPVEKMIDQQYVEYARQRLAVDPK